MTAVTADKIIIEIEAATGKARADVATYQRLFGNLMGGVEKSAIGAERQFKASAAGISSSIKGLAATFAAGFSAKQVADLADGYTKFTNQLKVAGLEGASLARTQEDLYQIAQRYGTELESVGTLYGRLSGNTKELGLSQAQLLQFVEGTSAALKVSGQSAGEATGALLQLSQALGGSKIQAEEYNSLIDGARPLLQAVANGSDRFAGSVSKLTAAVKDGKVSTQEFVQAGLKGIPQLIAQSEKAGLTIGASFTILNNALGKYVGQTDQALSATQRISQGIQGLADNLDTVIPALAVIATFIGVRYVASVGLATAATIAKAVADVRAAQTATALAAAEARLSGLMLGNAAAANAAAASVTRLSVAQGVAARSGGALIALMGGPYGAALIALGAGFYALTSDIEASKNATGAYAKAQGEASAITDRAANAAEKLATAHGKARAEALKLARAEAENIKQKLASAKASAILAQAELSRVRIANAAREQAETAAQFGGGDPLLQSLNQIDRQKRQNTADANANAANKTVEDLTKALKTVTDAINGAEAPAVAAVDDDKKKKGRKGRSGKTASEIAADHADELARLTQEELQAQLAITTDAENRAAISYDLLAEEFKQRAAQIAANKDFTAKQKAAQLAALKKLYGVGGLDEKGEIVVDGTSGLLGRAVDRDLQESRRDLERDGLSRERAVLEAQASLLEGRQARLAAEKRILEIVEREEKLALEGEIAAGRVADAQKARAQLAEEQAARRIGTERQYEGPLAQYRRDLNNPDRANDEVERAVVGELEGVRDSISSAVQKTLGVKNPILAALLNAFLEQQLLKPIAAALAGAGGGGGGLVGGLLNVGRSIFGFASGGSGVLGGRGGTDTNTLSLNGRPIANVSRGETLNVGSKALNGRGGGNTVVQQTFVLDARGGITTPELLQYVNQTAQQAGQAAYQGALRDGPVMQAKRQRFG